MLKDSVILKTMSNTTTHPQTKPIKQVPFTKVSACDTDSEDSLDILLNGAHETEEVDKTDDPSAVPANTSAEASGNSSADEQDSNQQSMSQIVSMLDFYFRDSQTGANLVETMGFGIQVLAEKLEENTKAVKTLNNNLVKMVRRNTPKKPAQ